MLPFHLDIEQSCIFEEHIGILEGWFGYLPLSTAKQDGQTDSRRAPPRLTHPASLDPNRTSLARSLAWKYFFLRSRRLERSKRDVVLDDTRCFNGSMEP
jgi:hypothetical protein